MPQGDPFESCGGYMNVKISKLENQVANSVNIYKQSNLFDGISIFVNGWTNPTADELKRIMMTFGGTYHHYERKHTTFIVAENLPDVKIRNMNTSNVISPKWVVDCIKANKILDYSKYLLYTNQKRTQPGLFFKNFNSPSEVTFSGKTDGNVKRKFASISDEKETTINSKIKTNSNQIETEMNDKNSSKSSDNSEDETDRNMMESEKAMYDPSVALEILNHQISTKTVLKIEKDESIKKSPEVNTTTNPFNKARTAKDPKFLSEFYNNSRLHHISTLGAGFKQYITELREGHTGTFPQRQKLLKTLAQKDNFVRTGTVMHIDMDCFFVSVGLKKHPDLKGCPLAVTHSKGGGEVAVRPGVNRQHELELYMKRLENQLQENVMNDKKDKIKNGFDGKESLSEIASCSYEARKKGVKNGMFVGQALKLCPDLKTIPYDFEGYKEVAFQLYDTIAQYTLDIEAVSCDEMFVDLTSLLNEIKVDVMDFVTYVRDEVKTKTLCPCSAGVGANRLQSRMATKKAKPDGQFYLDSNTVLEYMADIPIRDLPGVGYSTNCALKQLDLHTCGDLQSVALPKLQTEFGKKFGETLYQFCRGIDNRPLVFGQIRKSVSAEVNYGIRFTEYSELEIFLKQLCGEVHSRLININRKGKCITLKVMIRAKEAPLETAKFMGHGFCDSMNKSVSLSDYTSDLETITRTVLTIMKALNLQTTELRGLGIQISKLDDPNDAKKTNVIKNMFNKVIEKQKERKKASFKDGNASETVSELLEKTSEISEKEKFVAKPAFFQKDEHNTQTKNKTPETLSRNFQKTKKTPEKPSTSKGRGKSKAKSNTAVKQFGNILTMFQNASARPVHVQKIYSANEIDPKVFAELPEDMQREILKENRIDSLPPSLKEQITLKNDTTNATESCKVSTLNKKVEIDVEFLNALPENLRQEIEKDIEEYQDKFLIINKNNLDSNINTSIKIKYNNIAEIKPNQNDLEEAGPSSSKVSPMTQDIDENEELSMTPDDVIIIE